MVRQPFVFLPLLVLLACLAAPGLAAQAISHTVSGRVLGPDGLSIPGAALKLLGPGRLLLAEVHTDEEGGFRLEGIAAGRYELRVEASGFSPHQRVLDVPQATAAPLVITLSLTPVEFQVTVTGRHGAPEETFHEPASVRLRGAEELTRRDPAHLPRMLAQEPGVLAQETTPGQGSPILRGQGAQTVLYLVDGIRFNNSTYRSGNVQYLGWVPATAVESVELFLGPAGTQYGSDALGGAINVMSHPLPSWTDAGLHWHGETSTFFSSADLAGGSSLRASVAGPRAAFGIQGNFRRHQGLRPGGGEDSHNALVRFLGFTPDEVRGILGSRLRDTDYAQSSWSTRLGLRLTDHDFLTFQWLQSEQYGVRRYDRLLGGEGRLRSDLGPQRLGFGYARYQRLGTGRLRSFSGTFSINRQTDGQTRQTALDTTLSNEINRVTALGYLVSTSWAPVAGHSFTAGGEFYDEYVFGRRFERDPGGEAVAVRPRFPNGTRYQSLGLYVSDDWRAVPEKVLIETGARFSHFRFRTFADKNVFSAGQPVVPDAFASFTDLTFNAGLSYTPIEQVALVGRVARGFRAPSVFDLGEQGITGGGFEVSPDEAVASGAEIGDSAGRTAVTTGRAWQPLEPEVLWSFEGGLRWKLARVAGEVTLFDSEQFDSIQRRTLIVPLNVVGQSIGGETIIEQDAAGRIFVAADPRPVVSRANIGRLRVRGVEASARVAWNDRWSSAFKASALRGRELDTGNFARRIAPDFFFASLRWSGARGRVWLEGFTEVAGPQTRLNPSEVDDPRVGAFRTAETIAAFFENGARRLELVTGDRLTASGETVDEVIARVLGPSGEGLPLFTRTESFATLNLRGGWLLDERNEVHFALLNLTDANYRRHGSGFDAPGINLTLSYRWRFR